MTKGSGFILGPDEWKRKRHLLLFFRLMGLRRFAGYLKGMLWEQRVYLRLGRRIHDSEPICSVGPAGLGEGLRWVQGDLMELRRLRDRKGLKGLLPLECWTDHRAGLHWFQSLWKGEELMHIHWAALPGQKTSLLRQYVSLGEVEIRAAFTAPAFRSHGCFTLALQKTLADLAHESVHHVFAYVHPANRPSVRAFQKAGFESATQAAVVMRLGSLQNDTESMIASMCWMHLHN